MVKERTTTLIASVSLGLVLVFAHIWLLTQASILFPENTEAWRMTLIIYMVMTAFVFSFNAVTSEQTEKVLFKVKFLKRLPVFLISALITGAVLFAFGFLIKGNALPTIQEALASISIGVILFHALIVAVDEELIFRGFLVNELRALKVNNFTIYFAQAIMFALFHYAMAGGELLLLTIYIPLGIFWLYIRDRYSPKTNMANMGSHWMWNIFVLGFLR